MAGRLQSKRVVVTDASEFMGPDIVALFREEGGEVIADVRDLRQPGACEALIVEAGHVGVLMVNLAGASSGQPWARSRMPSSTCCSIGRSARCIA